MVVINGASGVGAGVNSISNSIVVTGSGSIMSNTTTGATAFTLAAGAGASFNSVNISQGGAFYALPQSSGTLALGNGAGANSNSVVVADTGSLFQTSAALHVGENGIGNTLTVTNGGKVVITFTSTAAFAIGGNGTNNSVVVSGSGSLITNAGPALIGNNANSYGNNLTIANSGLVVNTSAVIGNSTGASNNWAMVTGRASIWSNTASMTVGSSGASNSLTIASSGLVYNTAATLGSVAGADDNAVTVTDSGSVWTNTGTFTVGSAASFNTLTISNKGVVATPNGTIGNSGGANSNSVLVTDSGSLWSLAVSTLTVGNGGAYNNLVISNGAQVVDSVGTIGSGSGGNSNTVIVTGSGSVWSNLSGGTALRVGNRSTGNQLIVSNGATVVTLNELHVGVITNNAGAPAQGSVIITGPGSLLQVATQVNVGSNTTANTIGQGSVLITDGGTLEAQTLRAGFNNSGWITNSGGIYQFNTATPTIVTNTFGNIVLSSGTISFRDVTNANVFGNSIGANSNQLVNIAYLGNNAFRLNNSSNTAAIAQNYTFDSGFGATNYTRLELVNGTTLWRSGRLTIGGTSGSMLVSNTTARIAAVVTNQGTIQVVNSIVTWASNTVVSGGFITDPSTNIFSTNLTFTASGYLAGGPGDLFQFERNFLNGSTNAGLFDLTTASVLFTNGVGQHLLNLTGSYATDRGSNFVGISSIATNFAIGTFVLASTDTLRLTGAVANALYVGALDFGGLANTNNLTLDINLYYDSTLAANSYLASTTYDLAGAGQLIPYPGVAPVVPEPTALTFLVVVACGLLFRRARGSQTAA